MGNTNHYQIPYPELNMAPDGPSQMRGLAEKVDSSMWGEISALKTADTTLTNDLHQAQNDITQLQQRTYDTGPGAITVAYASGWAADSGCFGRRFGPFVTIYFSVKRTGGAITAASTGNVTDTLMFTISSATYRTGYYYYGVMHPATATGSPWEVYVTPAGNVYVAAAFRGGSVIATNDEMRANIVYMGG